LRNCITKHVQKHKIYACVIVPAYNGTII